MSEQEIVPTTLREFLEKTPPGPVALISDLGGERFYSPDYAVLSLPNIALHCESETCSGIRLFRGSPEVRLKKRTSSHSFVTYVCRNCTTMSKTFALWLSLEDDYVTGLAFKFGEFPQFGPPTPSRLISLIGPQKDLFLKGRRAENQGLGIAAFAYYRRVIEDQKNRIFDEIIKVSNRLSVDQMIIDELTKAKDETQFTKAVDSVKHGIPQTLLINGHNPLTLLHSALSEGMHADTDEECLEIATSIREVMAELAERMGQAMKDEAVLNTAVTRLLQKKSAVKQLTANTPPATATEPTPQ